MDVKNFSLTIIVIFSIIATCHTRLDTKTLTSENYPAPYSWSYWPKTVRHYSDSENNRIRILIHDVHLHPMDSLEIYDGHAGPGNCGFLLKSFKGSVEKKYLPMMLFSVTETICIKFINHQGGAGFYRGYRIEIFEFPRCNGELRDEYGDIVSPNYNFAPYKPTIDCEWTIMAEPGQYVLYNVEEYSVNCDQGDDVTINGGIGSLCQKTSKVLATEALLSRTNESSVSLKTNSRAKGFWLEYRMIGCSERKLPGPRHGNRTNPADYYYYGYNMELRCPVGHRYNEKDTTMILSCLRNSTWTSNKPLEECSPVDCGDPGTPSHARRQLINGYRYKGSVLYECDSEDGYWLNGSAQRVCQADGTWSGQIPECKSNRETLPTECGLPEDPESGYKISVNSMTDSVNVNTSVDTTTGSFLKFGCDLGYILTGNDTIECLPSGVWSLPIPTCQIIVCDEPMQSSNGFILKHDDKLSYTFRDYVQYDCHTGYQAKTEMETTSFCTRNGSWSHPPPLCEPIVCDEPTVPQNGLAKYDSLKYKAITRYTCNPGYTRDGALVSVCDKTGWTSAVPMCHPVPCPFVSNTTLLNALVAPPVRAWYEHGDEISVYCSIGYRMTEQSTMTSVFANCTRTGSWSYDFTAGCPYELHCTDLSTLTLPQDVELVNYDGNTYGDGASLECKGVEGKIQISCMGDGEWSKDLITICEEQFDLSLAMTERARKDKESRDMWIIIGMIIACCVIVLLVGFIIIKQRRRRRVRKPVAVPSDDEYNEYDNPVYGINDDNDQVIIGTEGDVHYSSADEWRKNPTFRGVEQTLERPDSEFDEEGLYGNAGEYAHVD